MQWRTVNLPNLIGHATFVRDESQIGRRNHGRSSCLRKKHWSSSCFTIVLLTDSRLWLFCFLSQASNGDSKAGKNIVKNEKSKWQNQEEEHWLGQMAILHPQNQDISPSGALTYSEPDEHALPYHIYKGCRTKSGYHILAPVRFFSAIWI